MSKFSQDERDASSGLMKLSGHPAYTSPKKIKASPEGKIWTVKEARGIGTDGDVPEQGWQTLPSPLVLNPGRKGNGGRRKTQKHKKRRGGDERTDMPAIKGSESSKIIKIQSELVKKGSLPKGGLTKKRKSKRKFTSRSS